ncbi:hypothetical protein D3C81_2156700 [compost metagenome]
MIWATRFCEASPNLACALFRAAWLMPKVADTSLVAVAWAVIAAVSAAIAVFSWSFSRISAKAREATSMPCTVGRCSQVIWDGS